MGEEGRYGRVVRSQLVMRKLYGDLIWLLKAVKIGGLVSTITPRTGFVRTSFVGPTTAILVAA